MAVEASNPVELHRASPKHMLGKMIDPLRVDSPDLRNAAPDHGARRGS